MNLLCPICEKPFIKVNGMYVCEQDGLYADPKVTSFSYSDDYILRYELLKKIKKSDEICRARWEFLARNVSFVAKNLLDYGCGASAFSDWWREKYPKIFKYDPYFFRNHSFLDVDIDIMTLWDSLEHISKLDILPLINAKHVFMTLPVIDDVKDITMWKHYAPYEHLWYFTTDALTKLFGGWGYKLMETSTFEAKYRSPGIKSFYFVNSS